MYKVYCDEYLLYSDTIQSLRIHAAKVDLELNKTGAFNFTIYSNHPYYNFINKMKSIITVYQDDFLIFRGRPLNVEYGFRNEKVVSCEGELAFMLDSIVRPYTFSGSITEYLTMLINSHNEQVEEKHRFTLGNVTVTDPNDTITRSDEEARSTWAIIEDKLIKNLGGYIFVRHEAGINYIDYLSDFTLLSSQKVQFGKNLLSFKRAVKGENIKTALIPYGSKLTDDEGNEIGQRLTITEVNDGKDYIYDEDAVAEYGYIFATETWDDVTLASNLLTKAKARLATLINPTNNIDLTAADLAAYDKKFTSFHLGTYVTVESESHGIDQNFLVQKISIILLNPSSNSLVLGSSVDESFTEKTNKVNTQQLQTIQKVANNIGNYDGKIYQVEQNLMSSIASSSENILATVEENYYLKDDADALVSSISTSLELTKESFEIQFNTFQADLEAIATGTDAEFEEIRKYIRFEDGKILLGEAGNSLQLEISNDRISFLQNNAEVAYFSNNKLYVTDGEYTNSLTLGNFAFVPRANGNLSFKKLT